MEILNKDYLEGLIELSKKSINEAYNFVEFKFTQFDFVNLYLINNALSIDRANLLISIPQKDRLNDFMLPSLLLTTLDCFKKNTEEIPSIKVGDIIVSKEDGRVSTVMDSNSTSIRILPLGDFKRVDLINVSDYVQISSNYASHLIKLEFNRARIKRFESNILTKINDYKAIIWNYKLNAPDLPLKHRNKVVLVASKSESLPKIPGYIPFQYVNKNGEVTSDTPFDPLLIVVNEFNTVKNHLINKGIPIETIVFIGDNKYLMSNAAISRSYRKNKLNRCIFIGTEDIETGEHFEVLKWNWTLRELKYFNKLDYQNLTPEIINNQDLSKATSNLAKFIDETEKRYEYPLALKRLLKFIRKIYPITSIGNEKRIAERAKEIYTSFESEAEEVFQEEYYNIDEDYNEDLNQLKSLAQDIIKHVIYENAKEKWFKNATGIDFIVVPKPIKKKIEEEIQNSINSKQKDITTNSLEHITSLWKQPAQNASGPYFGLRNTKVITVSDFLKKEVDNKIHLFLSLYSNGIFTETLLQKILSTNHKTKILCYEEEAKVIHMYLRGFQKEDEIEFRSFYREQLSHLKFPETPTINPENIDAWITHLIDLEETRQTKADEQRYVIEFEEGSKSIERESKKVFVDGYEDFYKEVKDLKIGDEVRIYYNPDKETLHDIIKLTDEKELFTRVDKVSSLWKEALRRHYRAKWNEIDFENFYSELKENGLSISTVTVQNWLNPTSSIKFPQALRDILAIAKTINSRVLSDNINNLLSLKKEYNGRLNKAGRTFKEEIDHYIFTKEKGKMLEWLSDEHIEEIIESGAPLRTIKSIKIEEIKD